MEVACGKQALQREADHRQAERGREAPDQGLTISQAYKRLQVSDQTFYRWRLKYGALKEDETPGYRVETLSSCTGSTSISNRFAF